MSVLKYDVVQLEDAKAEFKGVNSALGDAISKTVEANTSFISIQMGAWANEEAAACVAVETDARIFKEAMESLKTKFDSLVDDAKAVRNKRDSLVEEMGTSAPNPNKVTCDTGGTITAVCSEAIQPLNALEKSAQTAQKSLNGLRDSSTISLAIENVSANVRTERIKTNAISTQWSALQSAAQDFESTYSSADG